jgi:2-polyprenyl-6-methoxyphenol hydroxylase-like FAD-dependent oxidoreductase
MGSNRSQSEIVIVGAGPAGALLAAILSSRALRVALVEKQRDFAREFRGQVLMPGGVAATAAARRAGRTQANFRGRTLAGRLWTGPAGRGDWIRTSDLFVPNEARYQAAPRPDWRVSMTSSDGPLKE